MAAPKNEILKKAAAAIEQAKKGDKKIAFVDLPGLNGEEK